MEIKKTNILFVDDEENILNALKRELIEEPYNQFFATSVNEAFKILKENEIAVIVTDLNMPEVNGLELLYSAKQNYPHIARIILSAFTDTRVVLEAIKTGETHFYIPKPWKLQDDLLPMIEQAIKHYKKNKEFESMKKEIVVKEKLIKELNDKINKLQDKIVKFEKNDIFLKK